MRKLLVALIGFFSVGSVGAGVVDMGGFGNSYPVIEQDIVEFIKQRLSEMEDQGLIEETNKELVKKSKDYVKRPPGSDIPVAKEYSGHVFDPTVTIQRDISDEDGNVIYPAGTVVNPLDYRGLTRTLCFIDGDDVDQIEWVRDMCPYEPGYKQILVSGPILEVSKEEGHRFYFDQHGVLVNKFRIKAVPAVVRQSGKVLYVEQFPVN